MRADPVHLTGRRVRSADRRRALGAVSALIVAVCVPLTAAPAAQARPQAPTQTEAQVQTQSGAGTAATTAGRGRHSVITWGASADRQGAGPADRSYRMIVRT